MVIGEQVEGGEAMPPSPQQFPPQKATIENIMSGIENTGAVKMNNHRKKLRQRLVPTEGSKQSSFFFIFLFCFWEKTSYSRH